MKTNDLKNTKAITLVALIVTLIVLLILAGVSIAVLTGENGIINRTTSAKKTTEEAEAQEKLQLELEALKIDYYKSGRNGTFSDYVAAHEADLKVALGDNSLKVNANNGKITTGGYEYTVNEQGSITSKNVKTTNPVLGQIKVGDYVNYDPMSNGTTGTTYTSYSASNASPEKNNGRTSGYDSDQTFDAAKYVAAGYRWRVLDVNQDDGTIRLISEETFGPGDYGTTNKTTYYLYGQQGYINGENELKEICKIFGHGKGAESSTSITEQDIFDITGFDPSNSTYSANNGWDTYGSKVTYTRGEGDNLSAVSTKKDSNNNYLSWSGTQSIFNYFNGTTFVPLTNGSVEITSTNCYHGFIQDPVSNHELIDSNGMFIPQYEVLFGKQQFDSNYDINRDFTGATDQNYWLAFAYVRTAQNGAMWGIGAVISKGLICNHYIPLVNGSSNSNGSSRDYGVRPIVTLKSDVQLKWNGTTNQWEIQ